MTQGSLTKAAITTAFLVIIAVLSWEFYLRKTGFERGYDDGGPLWAHHRDRIYQPIDEATVFIGSSRIKFDLDIPTWEKLTGEEAVQLACVGSTPRPLLTDLAEDPEFKGKVIVDVTEGLFFSLSPQSAARPKEGIDYHQNITPTQRAAFILNKPLESSFLFLDKDHYSINAMLDALEIPSRQGVFMFPIFPRDFGYVNFNRQEYMGKIFMADTNQQNRQKEIWAWFGKMNRFPPTSGPPLDSILLQVKTDVDKIKARGGKVLFVRTPSSGPFLEMEQKGFPREKYWDRLLVETDSPGIHFQDFPEINHYICPEFSHLSPEDAIDFTIQFVEILQDSSGWTFPKKG